MPGSIWTIGHSNRSWEAFRGLLAQASIGVVADVRRFPGSRRHPHFHREVLAASLEAAGVAYRHFAALGGRRHRRAPGSPNTAWQVEAFNAFADHMATAEFQNALSALCEQAAHASTALLCSEALPWRCHRRLIADALIARGWTVWNILGPGQVRRHTLTPFAVVEGQRLIYPRSWLGRKPGSWEDSASIRLPSDPKPFGKGPGPTEEV
jgi:uncharacterized protein (DUF488 family)